MTGRRETVWVHDLAGDRVAVVRRDFIDLWTDERLDQTEQFGFTVPADHRAAEYLIGDAELEHRGRRYFITEVEPARSGNVATITVEADALWYRLGDTTYVGTLVLDDVTPAAGLATILDGSGWAVDLEQTVSTDTFSLEAADITVLALCRQWAKITGLNLRFDTIARTVRLVAGSGRNLGIAFRYGRNLRGVRKRTRPPEFTVLYPYGKDDLTIAGVNGGTPYLEDFTHYTDRGLSLTEARERFTRSRVWSDRSFVRDVDLLPAAAAILEAGAAESVTYELDVLDLAEHIDVNERAQLGDTVRVYDPQLGDADVRPVVVRFRRHWLTPWRNRIELATILDPLGDTTVTDTRTDRAAEWVQFVGPVRANYQVRNDGTYTVARIPLRFGAGGRANFHLDLWATGVGSSGTMTVTVTDEEAGDLVQFRTLTVPYTAGQTVRVHAQWAAEELTGPHNYRVRVTTTTTAGASPSAGVNITADAVDPAEASFWVLAQGAVQETPTVATSQTFEYTGAVQTFVVPDNVHRVDVFCRGAAGGGADASWGGRGAEATATGFAVTPGQTLYVYVGGQPIPPVGAAGRPGGWPNGGDGGSAGSGGDGGNGGGGSSHVLTTLGDMSTALIVAPGGGGANALGSSRNTVAEGLGPGDGGFFRGTSGNGPEGLNVDDGASTDYGGGGATQFAGGIAGVTALGAGEAGSFGQGGRGQTSGTSSAFQGGGGGGGWYGGGGAGQWKVVGGGRYAGDGGGGSGWVRSDGTDLELVDATSLGHGQVRISWEAPV